MAEGPEQHGMERRAEREFLAHFVVMDIADGWPCALFLWYVRLVSFAVLLVRA